MNDPQIEHLLRQAPAPAPPPALKSQLFAAIALPPAPRERPGSGAFWRRWFPALSFGVLILGCLIGLAIQTAQLIQLRRENASLCAATADLDRLREAAAEREARQAAAGREVERQGRLNEELEKLRAQAATLRAATDGLSTLRTENQRLQQQRNAALAAANAQSEEDPFTKARERAERIACTSNMKQIGLAALMWANDNNEVLPEHFTQLTNELVLPKVLFCPSDKGKARPNTWAVVDENSFSYELLAPGFVGRGDPQIVLSRCRLHHNCGLIDGSVQQLDPKRHRIDKVDGKYRIVVIPATETAPQP